MVVAGILLTWAIIRILRRVVLPRLNNWISKTSNSYDDLLLGAGQKYVLPYLYLLINYQIILGLHINARVQKILAVAMAVVTTYFVVRLINHVVQLSVNGFMRRRNESTDRIRQLSGVLFVIKALMWLVGFIFFLGNLGYDVRTFIAGLGVGGIAIALAAQTVLVDLFSYFVIFFDKPFEIGDFVTTPSASGVVEQIGIKTTRLRSLDGEQLVMSNTDLTKSTIRNYKRLEKRRALFNLQVVYSTDKAVLREIPTIIREIINAQEMTTFDRAHLSSLGASSINFEVVYIVESSEFGKFMDTQQAVLLRIMETFEARGIEFAYPTQTVFLNNALNDVAQTANVSVRNKGFESGDANH